MIMRVKFKTIPGEQFVVRREVFRRMQEAFRENGIEFAHRNVTVYLPPQKNEPASEPDKDKEASSTDRPAINAAGAAAALAAIEEEERKNKPQPKSE